MLKDVPDFTDPRNLALVRSWEGDFNQMHQIKMVRLRSSEGEVKDAAERIAKAEGRDGKMETEKEETKAEGEETKDDSGEMKDA